MTALRVLVTGASGRIGSAVCRALQAQGHAVSGLDIAPGPHTTLLLDLGDGRQAGPALRQALRGVRAVVHCAALHAPHVGQRPDADFLRVNVQGTQTLLDAAAACGVARFVYTSTTALYGAGTHAVAGPDTGVPPAAHWCDEDTPPQPQTIYHRSKLAAEALLQQAAAQSGPVLRVLRMSRCFAEPLPAMLVYRLHRGVGEEDVAQAHARALDFDGPPSRCWVVSHPTPFERSDAAALGADAAGVMRLRAPALVRAFQARGWPLPTRIDRVYDARRALAELGWQPRQDWRALLASAGASA